MPSTLNQIPESVTRVHLVAICGTAMGALAALLKEQGMTVSGSDAQIYPPMSTFLADRGIRVFDGFDGAHIDSDLDLVIIGNAVRKDNPEVEAVVSTGLPYCSMPQAVNRFLVGERDALLATGTHGKTTTSSLLAWVLAVSGQDPSFLIGGILANWSSNYRCGQGAVAVIEGDEYDTAFFDKRSKFFHYPPAGVILTSIEFDHADIFRDADHVASVFAEFIATIAPGRPLLAYDADPVVRRLVAGARADVLFYGFKPDSDIAIHDVVIEPPWTTFRLVMHGQEFGRFRTRMMGEHNLANIAAVAGLAHARGVTAEQLAEALETFAGVRRRQEVRGRPNGITVLDDFAHHPTAVRETIRAVRPFCKGRLFAIFEPRTNTSMRDIFQRAYTTVFDRADRVLIREPSRLDKVPVTERFSTERLVADLTARGVDACRFPETDAVVDAILKEAHPGDTLLIMSNGGFDDIHTTLIQRLGETDR